MGWRSFLRTGRCQAFGFGGVEVFGLGLDADSGEVEAISVPAAGDGEVVGEGGVGVVTAGVGELLQLLGVDGQEALLMDLLGEFGGAGAVSGVEAVVVPLRVMKECEEDDDGLVGLIKPGEVEAVVLDALPVFEAMDALAAVERAGEHGIVEQWCNDGVHADLMNDEG